jgi:hypothetical protein
MSSAIQGSRRKYQTFTKKGRARRGFGDAASPNPGQDRSPRNVHALLTIKEEAEAFRREKDSEPPKTSRTLQMERESCGKLLRILL